MCFDWGTRMADMGIKTASIHFLKCWPEYYRAIIEEEKTFEIRKNDRGYNVGDLLILREYDPTVTGKDKDKYTGRSVAVLVRYVFKGFEGLNPEFVCMSIDICRDVPAISQ